MSLPVYILFWSAASTAPAGCFIINYAQVRGLWQLWLIKCLLLELSSFYTQSSPTQHITPTLRQNTTPGVDRETLSSLLAPQEVVPNIFGCGVKYFCLTSRKEILFWLTLEFNELRARLLFHPGDNAMGGVASNIVTEADLLTPMLMTVVTWQVFCII